MIAWVWLRWTAAGVVIGNAPNMTGERVRGEQAAQTADRSVVAGPSGVCAGDQGGRRRSHHCSHPAGGGRQPPWGAATSAVDHQGRTGGRSRNHSPAEAVRTVRPVGEPGGGSHDIQKTSGGHPMVVWH